MLRVCKYLAVGILCAIIVNSSFGQAALGTQKFGSFGGGPFDKLNLGNLNTHFDIPAFHKAGRGLPFNFDLSYDSTFWQPVVSGSTTLWNPMTTGGWSGSAVSVGSLAFTYTTDGATYAYYCNLIYYDGVGASHPFPGCAQYVYPNDYLYQQVSLDGSGYTLSIDPFYGTSTLTAANGNSIIPRDVIPLGAGVKTGSVIDRNGNEITGDSSGHYTDTLGTTVLTAAGGCSSPGNCSPYTLTYTAPSNAAAAVTTTFKSYTIKTNFGCPGIAEYGPQTGSLVDRVTLPDGTFYQFTYEATPGVAGDVTGRLASVKLPTGGTISYAYTGGHNGIECSDGTTSGLTRSTPDGTWTYSRTQGTGSAWTTTVTDPQGNQSVINFQKDSSSNPTYSFYETQRQIYEGPIANNDLLSLSRPATTMLMVVPILPP